jgi:hypothetical protein
LVKLFQNGVKKPLIVKSDMEGRYRLEKLKAGVYRLEVSSPHFNKLGLENIQIKDRESRNITAALEVSGIEAIVGLYAEEPLIDMTSSTVQTTITRNMIRRIPF